MLRLVDVRTYLVSGWAAAPIMRTGENLGTLPAGWWQDLGAVMFPVREPDEWCDVLPVRANGGGRGPL